LVKIVILYTNIVFQVEFKESNPEISYCRKVKINKWLRIIISNKLDLNKES